ncbi:exonuclease domain-containing protein [Corynebacterium pseudogenitalium]|uniref:3'-5' exoribonuclease n=1 Tax=Corynebacterium pseudogenitalium TaxID=38303 RepID=A0ABD4TM93_9CORY|nr:3'-5' exoribonuclease [Corynebacterium pseudogenitalium]
MITASRATLSVSNTELVVTPTPLEAALAGSSEPTRIPIEAITKVDLTEGDDWSTGTVSITCSDIVVNVVFAPGAGAAMRELEDAISAAQRGDAPTQDAQRGGSSGLPGFDFVAFDVETANQRWGSICQIGAVKVIDGVETDRVSWLCMPPEQWAEFDPHNVAIHGIRREDVADAPSVADCIAQLVEFAASLPLVAHNAHFDSTALFQAAGAVGIDAPQVLFACSLAQARSCDLDVENHKLPTLASHFGVPLEQHHDACADAAACAGIMVGLARRAHYQGSLVGFVHDAGFTLGSIDSHRVTPVLRDRSGAGRALQAESIAKGGMQAAAAAVPAPAGSNQAGPSRKSTPKQSKDRKPAPWQAVATPDTVPEPALDADASSPLFGQHVTLTGEFSPFDKGALWQGIAAQGGQVGKNVTKKTTILVVGEWGSMTSKEKRARQLIEQGQDIAIWKADQLLDALGLNEQPPF